MEQITQEKILHFLSNSAIYGTAQAEKRVTGRTSVFSKKVFARVGAVILKMFEDSGIKVEVQENPIEMISQYADLFCQIGILSNENLVISKGANELNMVVKVCPFASACTQLKDSGMPEIDCHLMYQLLAVTQKIGVKTVGTSQFQPENCQIHFK